jgi:hypothetical protein
MELELKNTIIGSVSKNILKVYKKIQIWILDDQNRLHGKKLKDKNHRGHNK